MNTKHTPGPWTVIPKGKPFAGDIADNTGAVVAQAYLSEHQANGLLIAAAPELLDALEDAEFLLRKIGNNPREVAAMVDSFKRSAEDARAAIAKAIGKQ